MATIQIEMQDDELWGAIFGSGFEHDPVVRNWLTRYEYLGGADWDKAGQVQLHYVLEEDDDMRGSKTLTVSDLANALSLAMSEGYRHSPCGGAITTDTDDWDACIADLLLQLAIYGKEVWA